MISTEMLAARQRIAELEAQCAAMRQIIEKYQEPHNQYAPCTCDRCEAAAGILAGDAGKSLLDELKKLRAVADAAELFREAPDLQVQVSYEGPTSSPSVAERWELICEALNALKEKA